MNRYPYIVGKNFLFSMIIVVGGVLLSAGQEHNFDFKRYLFKHPTLYVSLASVDRSTGEVTVVGYDSKNPSTPFTFDWGDGTINNGKFPQEHCYPNVTSNYFIQITAHYSDGEADSLKKLVLFSPQSLNPVSLPDETAVSIPDCNIELTSRMPGYGIPNNLTYFDESYFNNVPRRTIEYILSVAASIQSDFANDNVYLFDGGFRQYLLKDSAPNAAMYSLWFTNPVTFGVGDCGFQGDIQWSSFIHEMGHNFTLNTPAYYYYGGKIDGCANAIYSESMANIFQHATAYEIINNADSYGLFGVPSLTGKEDIIADIKQSAISSIYLVRNSYEAYCNTGMNFRSWNDPGTIGDETFYTFMTIAYKFFEHAENSGEGYRIPLKRMMALLQIFNPELRQLYDQHNNTAEADSFRATLMVAALSYAFSDDLRTEFRNLHFPVSDEIYVDLIGMVTGIDEKNERLPLKFTLFQNYPNPFNPTTNISFSIPNRCAVSLKIYNILGKEVTTLVNNEIMNAGRHRITWDASDLPSGIYFYRLAVAGQYSAIKKCILVR